MNELMRLPTAAYSNPPAKCWSAVPAAYHPAPSLFCIYECSVRYSEWSHAGMITMKKKTINKSGWPVLALKTLLYNILTWHLTERLIVLCLVLSYPVIVYYSAP